VVVAGYGEAARELVRVLHRGGVPYVITTLNPGGASEADEAGFPVLRGDATRARTLQMAGAERARAMVIADDDPGTALRITTVARSLNPTLQILVRTRYAADTESLLQSGADIVVAEETEAIARLTSSVLGAMGVPAGQVDARVEAEPVVALATFRAAVEPADVVLDPERTVTFAPVTACGHVARVRPVHPSARGCEECLRTGDRWVHLRICMTCGHVGCCDSSPNRHASAHFQTTLHPIMRSAEPGDRWGWCYVDERTL
jgi:CPA2 family monovalent cation:H+ antiporter-2